MARASTILSYPFRIFYVFSKGFLTFLFLASFALSVLTVTSASVFGGLSTLVASVTGLTTVRQTQIARVQAVETEVARLESARATLAEENDRLTRELADTRVTYRGESRLARDAVADTSSRVASRMTASTARNLAAMPGEALPFVGFGVIVAATAWELSDACEMMTDLHALDVAFNPENAIEGTEVCGLEVPTSAEIWEQVRQQPSTVWAQVSTQYENLPEDPFGALYDQLLSAGSGVMVWLRGDAAE